MNKKPFGLILIQLTVIISGLVTACGKANTPTPVAATPTATSTAILKKITPEEARELLSGKTPPPLIDVREPYEFDAGHIPGAVNVPSAKVVEGIEALRIAKDAPLILYCRSGSRSANAAKKLSAAGFTHVLDLGGIIDWTYEVE